MDTIQEISEILGSAERSLATLASDVMKESNYGAAALLIDLAKQVKALAEKARQSLDRETVPAPATAEKCGGTAGPPALHGRRQPKKGEYPKFLREGDSLIKVGWSRSGKAEYEHKAPKKVLALLTAAIGQAAANGKRFTISKVVPLVDPADHSDVPEYQVYAAVAWLRAVGVLKQHGRQGYTLSAKPPFEPLLENHWGELPSR